jgi:hypothetical protein
MLSTTHAAAGALIGVASRSVAGAASAGWCSHFALDALPHWGSSDRARFLTVARIDGIVMLAASAVFLAAAPRTHRLRVAVGVVAAVAPDLDKPVRHFFNRSLYPATLNRFHGRIQRGKESERRLGVEAVRALVLVGVAWRALRSGR